MLIACRHDLPVAAGPVPSVNDLVRIATDTEPDCGDYGPELVLGPWADLRLALSVRQTALAWCAWIAADTGARRGEDAEQAPLERVMRDKAISPKRRSALHALARAPTALYQLTPVGGERYAVRGDASRLGAAFPEETVVLSDPVARVTADLPTWVIGRAARGHDGWVLVAPIAVPPWDDDEDERAAWSSLADAARAVDPSVRTYADAARRCGHLWTRQLLTRWWDRHG